MALARFKSNLSMNKVGAQLATIGTGFGIGYYAGYKQTKDNETLPYVGPIPVTGLAGLVAMAGGVYLGGTAGDYVSAIGTGAATIAFAEVGIRKGQESGAKDPAAKNKTALPVQPKK